MNRAERRRGAPNAKKPPRAKKVGTVMTRGGLRLVIWRMENRDVCLMHGTQLIFIEPDEAELLKNLIEKAESRA